MPKPIVTIVGSANNGAIGKYQFPIKSYIEEKGESFDQQDLLKFLYRHDKSKRFGESFHTDTALDEFEPVGEGGAYPESGTVEGFSQNLEHMTWKKRFVVSSEMVEDDNIHEMKSRAAKLMNSYERTRQLYGRALYVGGLTGTTVNFRGKNFKCSAADGLALFSKVHPNAVDGKRQSNLYDNAFSADALDAVECEMQNRRGDNGEILAISPDTIWIPNKPVIKRAVFEVLGADKDPDTANNGWNFQVGRWNVIVDPYLAAALDSAGITSYVPWFMLDSSYMEENDGAVFLQRRPLTVKSTVDENNDNNLWSGSARFVAGFADYRFVAAGGVTNGTHL